MGRVKKPPQRMDKAVAVSHLNLKHTIKLFLGVCLEHCGRCWNCSAHYAPQKRFLYILGFRKKPNQAWKHMEDKQTLEVMVYICPGTSSEHHLVTHSVCSETEHALYLSSHMRPQRGIHQVKIQQSLENKKTSFS